MNKQLAKNLAIAVVDSGVNVAEGEEVLVQCSVEARMLAHEIVKRAYKRGAKRVYVNYRDGELNKLDYSYQTAETMESKPQFMYDIRNYFATHNGSLIVILCDDPNELEHADTAKITRSRMADAKGFAPYREKAMSSKMKWSIISFPHPAWAKRMFPDLSEKDALKKLGKYIAKTTRVDNDDPVAAWKNHAATLKTRCEKLNAANIKSFRYTNALGTDLTVGMPEHYIFAGGEEMCNGTTYNANMPTEEVFSAPDCRAVNGVVKASMPLCYNGKIIEGIELKLKDGIVVEFSAKTNVDVLKGIIETDDGAQRFGEIALVPYDSPISKLNTLFYETLFDENASCHFALGQAYASCVDGGVDMTPEQLEQVGLNKSDTHVDFMVGTRDLSITAETRDGRTLQIFKNGNFTPDFE